MFRFYLSARNFKKPAISFITMFCRFHRPVPENYGIWRQLRIDGGSEFTLV